MPVLAMAEAIVTFNPKEGVTVNSEPGTRTGETAGGVEYTRTTTDTGARTLEIIGQNANYEKTTTSPGNSSTSANYDGPEGWASYYKSKRGKPGDTEIERTEEHDFDSKPYAGGSTEVTKSRNLEEDKKRIEERPPGMPPGAPMPPVVLMQ